MTPIQLPDSGRRAALSGPAFGSILAFVAGYVDVVGFISLFGLFTAHVTGNFVMIGVDIAGDSTGLLAKLLALPTFALAVAATRLTESRMVRNSQSAPPLLLFAEATALALFMIAGLHASPISAPDTPVAIVAGMLAVVALGIQNALSRTSLSDLGPTTIMTGNTTQIVIDLVDLPSASEGERKAIRGRLKKMVPALAGFASGAALGALGYSVLSLWCVVLPIVLLMALSLSTWRDEANSLQR
ncbi:YoaK family protein [Pandoraea communis]|uniref:Permease n=1 Tax=Pandoraea communis TaxID=2508297 RepID=A0A5E4XNV9_9BURK|nr:YoaK family protein [Pandoraea communis]MDM8356880.1 YoaK family protein [Pandoraea communis]VVE38201.1 permease [Pandoraea communis]